MIGIPAEAHPSLLPQDAIHVHVYEHTKNPEVSAGRKSREEFHIVAQVAACSPRMPNSEPTVSKASLL